MVTSNTKIQVLKFGGALNSGGFTHGILDCSTAHDIHKSGEKDRPLIYIIPKEELPTIRRFNPVFFDRGVKNRHKGLTEYLIGLKQGRIPLIDGNYGSTRQLERSLRTFYQNASARKDNNLFIIGVRKDIFDELWLAGPAAKATAEKKKEWGSRYCPDLSDADETVSGLLHDLWKIVEVPPELEKKFVGSSWKMDLVRRFIMLAAEKETPVLIQGDTGTGKEIVARSIHLYGLSDKPFNVVNCGGIPSELFEAELFGYMPGCFTGSNPKGKKGLWELTDKGTLFLDEIGELPILQQAKILRALGSGTIRRLCGEEDIKVNARVIAATNRDLSSMIKMGRFREDLYYRLRGIPIHTPALKDHPDDIPMLAEHFWARITDDHRDIKTPRAPRLPRRILNELQSYRWPGNARELKAVLNNLYILCGTKEAREKDLKRVFYWQGQNWSTRSIPASEGGIDLLRGDCWRHLRRTDDVIRAAKFELTSISEGKKADLKAVSSAQAYLEFHLGELAILCREHMLFHTEKTYYAVMRFRERLSNFRDLLQEDVKKAREYWQETLAAEFETVISAILREGERVLGGRR